jgi:hypothetical protein
MALCRDEAKNLELLVDQIVTHWEPVDINPNQYILDPIYQFQAINDQPQWAYYY